VSEWISVKERIPVDNEYVLALARLMKDGTGVETPILAQFNRCFGWVLCNKMISNDILSSVRYWMPLPEFPNV
jgi:hypothetical protein